MSKTEQALDLIIAVGCGVATCVMTAQGMWKGLRRTLRQGRSSALRADRVSAAAKYQSGGCRPSCEVL
jgi:hypothetical protein